MAVHVCCACAVESAFLAKEVKSMGARLQMLRQELAALDKDAELPANKAFCTTMCAAVCPVRSLTLRVRDAGAASCRRRRPAARN